MTSPTGLLIMVILYWIVLVMVGVFGGSRRWVGADGRTNMANDLPLLFLLILIGIRDFPFWR